MPAPGAPPVHDAFGVLAHPVRRQLLEQLTDGERRVSELARRVPVTRSAVSQHLRLMLSLGVVAERRAGREHYYRMERDGLREVEGWLVRIDRSWAERLRRLGEHLEREPVTGQA